MSILFQDSANHAKMRCSMTKVDIYWNLIKKRWSVRSREGDTYGKVAGHLDDCVIVNVKFVVNPRGFTYESYARNHRFL